MPFVEVKGLKGKVYIPEQVPFKPKKHNCRECFTCQLCSDDRCNVCLNKGKNKKSSKGRREIMEFKTFDEIIKYAMEKEKEAAAFYEKAKDEKNYAVMKDALEQFAVEERKHCAMLQEFADDKTKMENYHFKSIPDLKISDLMTEIKYEAGMPYPDLLSVAMKREEQAFKFYNSLVEDTDDQEMSKIFKILSQEEAKHKNILETQYDDYMASQSG